MPDEENFRNSRDLRERTRAAATETRHTPPLEKSPRILPIHTYGRVNRDVKQTVFDSTAADDSWQNFRRRATVAAIVNGYSLAGISPSLRWPIWCSSVFETVFTRARVEPSAMPIMLMPGW